MTNEQASVIMKGQASTIVDLIVKRINSPELLSFSIEREKVSEFLDQGYTDMLRHFYPDQLDIYSRWSYRAGSRPRNVGWRIDYFAVNNGFLDQVEDIKYMTDTMGSDHCPIQLILK